MTHVCKYCAVTFASKSTLSRHSNHSCRLNPIRTLRSDKRKTVPHSDINTTINQLSEIPIIKNIQKDNLSQTFIKVMETPQKDSIIDILERMEKRLHNIENNHKTTTPNVFNIEKIQIFMTDSIDFIEVLAKRFGNRKLAVDYIKSKIHKKVEGDVDLFCEIYLNGDPDTWPISCPDKKNHIFRIAQPNSKVISDPGGVQLFKMFKNIYSNTLLRLNNSAIYDTLHNIPGTPEYEASRDYLLDSFELGVIQAKAHDLCRAPCDPFVKKLAVKFVSLQVSYELHT